LVVISTVGAAQAASEEQAGGQRRRVSTSGASFVNDFPLAVFAQPVLALLHLVVQIVAAVILLEGDDDDFFLARIAEHGQVVDLDLDPFLAGIDLLFLAGEFVKFWLPDLKRLE
jgi:hypothetical protein